MDRIPVVLAATTTLFLVAASLVRAENPVPSGSAIRRVDEVSASAVLAELRAAPAIAEIRESLPDRSIIGVYEGVEAFYNFAADEEAMAREATKVKGFYNGTILKFEVVQYTRCAPDLSRTKTITEACDRVCSDTGFVAGFLEPGVIRVEDKALTNTGDNWFLNRALGEDGKKRMTMEDACGLLVRRFAMAPDTFDEHIRDMYGDGTVWTGTERDQTARGLLCAVLYQMETLRRTDLNAHVTPFAEGRMSIARFGPAQRDADLPKLGGWMVVFDLSGDVAARK